MKFAEIQQRGFVRSARKGATGVGHTLEQLLDLTENNIALPDLGSVELKAHRSDSNSLITLFTFNRKAWKTKPIEAVRKYGTPDANGRMGLYFTMSPLPTSTGLFLYTSEDTVSVRHIDGEIIVEWNLESLVAQFVKKLPGLVIVSAMTEVRGGIEWFHYVRARLMTGTNVNIIRNQLQSNNISVDLRLHDHGTRARNHGTGFRTRESNLSSLFLRIEEI